MWNEAMMATEPTFAAVSWIVLRLSLLYGIELSAALLSQY